MNSICKLLAGNLEIRKETCVGKISRASEDISLFDDQGYELGVFNRLLVAAHVEQTATLLVNFPVLAEQISKVKMNPCWAAMAGFEKPVTIEWVVAFIQDSFLSWSARNSTKPGRTNLLETLVVHAGPDWTAHNWDRDSDEVAGEIWKNSGMSAGFLVNGRFNFWHIAGNNRFPSSLPVKIAFTMMRQALSHAAIGPAVQGSKELF